MIELLNKLLYEFTTEDESTIEDYIFIQGITNIILETNIPLQKPIYRSKMKLDKSLEYSSLFLRSIKRDYYDLLHFTIDEGIITFHPKLKEDTRLSTVSVNKDKKVIDIFLQDNIEDSYTVTHELMHYHNMHLDNITSNWNLITEGLSLIFEELQRKFFLMTTKHRDTNNNIKEELYALKVKACQIDFEINLIKLYMEYGFINNQLFESLFNKKSNFYINCVYQDLAKIKSKKDLNFAGLQRDIIGGILLGHFSCSFEEDNNYLKRIIDINDNCNNMSFIDTMRYLDLSFDDEEIVILDEKSSKRLEKEFKVFCRKIY